MLGVRTATPNFMTYGELGRTPIDIFIKLKIVNFWNRLISNEKKLSCILYKILFNLSIIDNVQFKWIHFIKSIFERTGLNYLWHQQQPVHSVQLKFIVKQNLTDQYIQNWFNESGRFGALKSDPTHHFFRNTCTKSGSLRFSQFSGC
jgi:hypothetical protein